MAALWTLDAHVLNPHRGILRKADLENRRETLLHHRERVGVVGVHQHHAVARDDPHQVRERFLDGRQVVENIGVVELEIVDDDEFGQVVEELAPLVEKGRVVLVALQNPVGPLLPGAALRQVMGQAADQVRGLASRVLEDPRQERRRGGLAVRSGHHQIVGLAQEIGLQRLGQREVIPLRFQRRLQLRIPALDRVAHHEDHVLGGQIFRAVTRLDGDALFRQEGRHRRVDVLVGTGDRVALVAQHRRHRAHRGPANAHEMKGVRRRLERGRR
jgi:hypothetical protein